jgi:hypothetical protein
VPQRQSSKNSSKCSCMQTSGLIKKSAYLGIVSCVDARWEVNEIPEMLLRISGARFDTKKTYKKHASRKR